MGKREKNLIHWLKQPPIDTPLNEVMAILKYYFPGQFHQRGSHVVVQDKRFVGKAGYGPEGTFTLPIKGGQRVKGVYLKRLAKSVKTIGLLRTNDEK